MIKGLIFDFDGLIIDTEVGQYQAWHEIYQEYDLEYPQSECQKLVGIYHSNPVPLIELERLKGPLDRETIGARHLRRSLEISMQQPILPGIKNYLLDAQRLNLKTAIGTSSPRKWLDKFLEPRDLSAFFDLIVTGDSVSQVKPSPEIFLSVITQLGVTSQEALILEDSVNGLMAARSAGIHCVIIPSKLTRGMDFSNADLILESLECLPLVELLKHFNSPEHHKEE